MNIVEKYGGSSVATIEKIQAIAKHVKEMKDAGHNIVLVASAMGKMTNKLIDMARQVGGEDNLRELDMLLATGEMRSVSLLAMAIQALGVDAISMTGFQAGFLTSETHSHARILKIDADKIKAHLAEGKVVVVAGFQGMDEHGDITTLGRGGSDTTAVALAAVLGYDCHIYTDVYGVYTCDPRRYPKAKRLKEISYAEMMQMACLGSGVLETRSVELASKYNVRLYLGHALEPDMNKGTFIMQHTKQLEDMPITGISVKEDYAILRVQDLPNDGKFLSQLFDMISALDINLDTISQQLNSDGSVSFSLYCTKKQSDIILANIDSLKSSYPISRLLGFVKLSVIGLGISTHSGIAAKVLNTLSQNKIRYYMITSSEISISLTIEESDMNKAIEVLGDAFNL